MFWRSFFICFRMDFEYQTRSHFMILKCMLQDAHSFFVAGRYSKIYRVVIVEMDGFFRNFS
jgi:hypothetical protein